MIKRFIPLAAIALAVSSAWAAPVPGSSGPEFYNAPSSLPSANGELLTYRQAVVKLGADAPLVNAWNVMYTSLHDSFDLPVILPVTGTVMVPQAAWTGGGARPVILYAVGTHGLGKQCAASKQLALGTDYEIANIKAALKAGYAVLVTDYAGYTTGGKVRYMSGPSQGRNVLDIFKAATAIPGAGVDSAAKVGIWGYSQGGQASAFAAQLKSTYAPGMNVVGVATGGIPGDFTRTANYLEKANGASFLFQSVIGLNAEYEGAVPINLAISDMGAAELEAMKGKCVFEALFDYQNESITKYTDPTATWTLDKLLKIGEVPWVLEEMKLGGNVNKSPGSNAKIPFPVYQYHGQADQFIPLDQAFALKQRWCAAGNTVKFDLYPSEHIATQFQGGVPSLAWLKDRFNGVAATNTCNITSVPTTTVNDPMGNLKVSLKAWPLTGSVTVKGLNQTVDIKNGSFTAETDINNKTLSNGSLVVPEFKQSLKILGIGAQVGLKIEQSAPVNGTASLDDNGILRVTGTAETNITVTSVWGIPFGQCKTQTPVKFPLNFEGPISALGAGMSFTGVTTFPPIKGCIISAIISALMSGSGQQYTFIVNPPAPKAN